RWPTLLRLSLTATANSRTASDCPVCESILSVLHTAKSGIDIGVVGPEPVAKRSAQQSHVRPRGGTSEHIMFAVKETSRVSGITRKGLEAGKGLKDRRCPLPSVANRLGNAKCTVSQWVGSHGNRIPSVPAKVSPPAIRLVIAPGIQPFFFTMDGSVRCPMKFGFGGQSPAAPPRKVARLFLGDVDRP